jgi:hypothetical protein
MKIFVAVWVLVGMLLTGTAAAAQPAKPTIVLVHGAFADSSSWYGVITILERDGYSVVAAANPLRSVKGDADTVRALLATINTPVVLVGHSYAPPPLVSRRPRARPVRTHRGIFPAEHRGRGRRRVAARAGPVRGQPSCPETCY